ncbi:unnamed protein product [Miscanthus lutarioriparius]|uniref:GRF-type domain-containing protein n=1 Tax=Miscanthus lutarioriparius TaxID=422564 RepID=A0A811SN65_9POAL|nr:unnamed protein product [Miscanthus lutarioriparius]
MGGGGSPMEGRGSFQSQSPQQRRSPRTFQPRSPVTSQPRSPGTSQPHANWVMTLEPAVHVPGGPFQPLPEHVLQRPFAESPVRYREGPLEYEGAVFCPCGQRMARFISWGCFPGRRFYSCMVARNGCGLSEWYDPPFSQYVINLVGDLREIKWKQLLFERTTSGVCRND